MLTLIQCKGSRTTPSLPTSPTAAHPHFGYGPRPDWAVGPVLFGEVCECYSTACTTACVTSGSHFTSHATDTTTRLWHATRRRPRTPTTIRPDTIPICAAPPIRSQPRSEVRSDAGTDLFSLLWYLATVTAVVIRTPIRTPAAAIHTHNLYTPRRRPAPRSDEDGSPRTDRQTQYGRERVKGEEACAQGC